MLSLALSPASLPPQAKSLTVRAMSILATYGTDAHLWLPGVGAVNGITAGNFIESTGTSAAAVDGPVGHVGDAGKALGPELITDGGMESVGHMAAPAGSGYQLTYAVTDGVFRTTSTVASAGNATRSFATVAGRLYRLRVRYRNVSATSAAVTVQRGSSPYTGLVSAPSTTSTSWSSFTGFFTAVSESIQLILSVSPSAVGQQAEFDDISIQEIVGAIPATQSTTASKPILRQSGGLYSWQFDGTDDTLTLSTAPFQIADAHAVVTSVRLAAPAFQTFFHVSTPGSPSYLEMNANSSGFPRVALRDSANTFSAQVGASALSTNRNYVASYKHNSGNVVLRIDGSVSVSGPLSTGAAAAITSGAIGRRIADGTSPMNGNIGPVIAIKGTVSDADLLTLERWVGSLSGVTL